MKQVLAAMAILMFSEISGASVLISKTSGGGYVPPEWSRYETCVMHDDKVVITHHYGLDQTTSVKTVREVPMTIGKEIADLLIAAKNEREARKENGLCDAPSTHISAQLADAKPGDKAFTLFSTGGCGSDRIEREGPASAALRHMIDQHCPTTHDHGVE